MKMNQIRDYIDRVRQKGLPDSRIKELLVDAGWSAHEVNMALLDSDELMPPRPNINASSVDASYLGNMPDDHHKQTELTVVSGGFSMRGFEYLIYYIAMGLSALAISALLHLIIDELFGTSSVYLDGVSIAIATIIVSLPIFIFLMLRLKHKEIADPTPLADTTKRRATQLMLLVTFLIGIGRVISFVFGVVEGGSPETPIIEDLVHTILTTSVASLIFFPLWLENQKVPKE